VRLGPQHIKGGYINITARKTGAELSIPVRSEFRAVLDTIPHKHLVYIATERGAARSEFAFTNWIIEAAKDAGLPAHRSPHGLRKAACVRLADAGCDVFEIMSITGHKNIAEVQTYVAAANKKKAAQSAIIKAYGA
jgi:integrase